MGKVTYWQDSSSTSIYHNIELLVFMTFYLQIIPPILGHQSKITFSYANFANQTICILYLNPWIHIIVVKIFPHILFFSYYVEGYGVLNPCPRKLGIKLAIRLSCMIPCITVHVFNQFCHVNFTSSEGPSITLGAFDFKNSSQVNFRLTL